MSRRNKTSGNALTGAKLRGDPLYAHFRLDDSPFYLIARTNGRYTLDMEHALKRIGMDLPRWRTLMIVHERNPSSISEIADRAVMRLSTMTRVAQRLNKAGFVRLAVRKNDARKTDVYLTAAGRATVGQVREVAAQIYRMAFGDFTASQIAALNSLLLRVHEKLAPPPPGIPTRKQSARLRR